VLQANTLPNGMTNKLVNQKNHSPTCQTTSPFVVNSNCAWAWVMSLKRLYVLSASMVPLFAKDHVMWHVLFVINMINMSMTNGPYHLLFLLKKKNVKFQKLNISQTQISQADQVLKLKHAHAIHDDH
jgi:hypothetical protein